MMLFRNWVGASTKFSEADRGAQLVARLLRNGRVHLKPLAITNQAYMWLVTRHGRTLGRLMAKKDLESQTFGFSFQSGE